MNPTQIAAQLKDWALAEGFDRAGVATTEPPEYGEHFVQWLARGFHGDMRYLAKRSSERLRPAEIFPGARSVLCVALQYYPLRGARDEPLRPAGLWSRVARYARGNDYHEVMGERLRRLARRIVEAFPGCSVRPYVDTGPVLERELAARSGIGVFGKNTNLLHPEAGSWFLLGELFLSLNLSVDPQLADLCGTCTACLDACPTDAFLAPYVLDSNRCISYWTIEHRGPIPAEMRSRIGGWVFGCDVCQEVCPVNADPVVSADEELLAVDEEGDIGLVDLLRMDREHYRAMFGRTAISRAKLEGLKRNAAVAMGNSQSEQYVPALGEALSDESPVVRSHAAWALGMIGGQEARRLLSTALAAETSDYVRQELKTASSAARSLPLDGAAPG